ncbi:MAG: hypothetical protein HW421_117 [Ignavibacteria bacterium]|nr:hypothetical protein [Ignavibacteria bacterium]
MQKICELYNLFHKLYNIEGSKLSNIALIYFLDKANQNNRVAEN